MTKITKSVLCNFAIIQVLPFLNNSKHLDLSYETDLDFLDCFGRKILCLITKGICYMKMHLKYEGVSKSFEPQAFSPFR